MDTKGQVNLLTH